MATLGLVCAKELVHVDACFAVLSLKTGSKLRMLK